MKKISFEIKSVISSRARDDKHWRLKIRQSVNVIKLFFFSSLKVNLNKLARLSPACFLCSINIYVHVKWSKDSMGMDTIKTYVDWQFLASS
jgi:hypothetical protein